ncbi:sensor histidine kinase [Tranquillimonas alkanivorans]|uniref:histidine kinase n=1 Tax=Tranquillimonas alkanivorans TaxID=441119 RepID=A0A1I5M5H5_9RHOB|nr:ATP-binding protein [Tranquillimonas alkanivorans]SFP04775.1 Two-component sensor histidine kinase, contains HisKA and HATPase domains [Tranquillimonas alkanivorans]
MRIVTLKVENDRDIVRLRTVGEAVVAGAGFSGFAATRIVTALLELGRNMIDHASGGRVSLFLSKHGGGLDLVIEAVDQGPGIRDPQRYLEGEPPTSGQGLGLGLRGVYRMAGRFDVQTGHEGTRVTAAFRTSLPERQQAQFVREITEAVARLDRDNPAELLARQNRELLDALQQRDMLMAEVHHRTKNNLSLVMGLMRLSRNASASDETKAVLRDLEGRVGAIAKVHDQLQTTAAANTVELLSLLREVAMQTRSAFATADLSVEISVEGDPVRMGSSPAVDLALVTGELITNACKHAFIGRCKGRITIACRRENGDLILDVWDDGIGLPADAERPERSSSLGWQMVRSMVQKHGGTLTTESAGGLHVVMRFNTELMALE